MSTEVDHLAENLISEMPEPQEHAIEQENSSTPDAGTPDASQTNRPTGTVHGDLRDVDGNSFDPNVHVTDESGQPKLTSSGKLKKKRKPRASKSRVAQVESPIKPDEDIETQARMAAAATVEAIGMMGRMLGGDEWAFVRNVELGVDERAQGIDAFTTYYKAKGVTDVPPGVIIAIWGLGYIGPRMAMPQTKSRLQLAWSWIKTKFARNRRPFRADQQELEA